MTTPRGTSAGTLPMECLKLPLRFERSGMLAREDRVSAVMSLLATLLNTPASAWPHAPWFGLLEIGLEINPALTEQAGLRDAFNRALTELGIEGVSVTDLRARRDVTGSGTVHLELTLQVGAEIAYRSMNAVS
jgi:hypothetical protein